VARTRVRGPIEVTSRLAARPPAAPADRRPWDRAVLAWAAPRFERPVRRVRGHVRGASPRKHWRDGGRSRTDSSR